MSKEVLTLFKAVVVDDKNVRQSPYTGLIDIGVVTDFIPTEAQERLLRDYFKPLDMATLFTREEAETKDVESLILEQIVHYVEVYGLGLTDNEFGLVQSDGSVVTMNYVRGVTKDEVGDLVRGLIYANRPVKDAEAVKAIIKEYNVVYDVNQIANNEVRVALFNPYRGDVFTSGDDAVRYMCYVATGQPLLIKSDEVMQAIRTASIPSEFFEAHALPLSQVFNRHKKLILAAKKPSTKTAINRISRMSKKNHVPVNPPPKLTLVADSVKNGFVDEETLESMTIRDKFKILNLLAVKRLGLTDDMFVIRNGKVHFETDRTVYSVHDIDLIETAILDSIAWDLSGLKDKTILLDKNVDYGLPLSRKQTVGQLPFYTKVSVDGERISAGIYWENDWGANDLDLSTIDKNGVRRGWGNYGAYDRSSEIRFSGDVVSAPTGAMEFMTSKDTDYGLYVNIYSGQRGCEMEIVVGADGEDEPKKGERYKWINDTVVREKTTLDSNNMVVGFVKDRTYTVYKGRMGGARVSGRPNPSVAVGMADHWTVSRLLKKIGVDFVLDKDPEMEYDYDLTYTGFSYDKLEDLLLNRP